MTSGGHTPSARSTLVGGLQWMLVGAFLAPPVVWSVARLTGARDPAAWPPVDLAVLGLLVVFVAGATITRRQLDSLAHERQVTRRRLAFVAAVLLAYLALDLLLSATGSNGAAGQFASVAALAIGSLVAHRPWSGSGEMRDE